jgi:DNA modification methylase
MERVNRMVPVGELRPNSRNSRTHSKKQIRTIASSIRACGFAAPVLIDESGTLLAGHARLEAAKEVGLAEIPAVQLLGLSETQKRALLIADNKLAEKAGWNREKMAVELPELQQLLIEDGLDISLTGYEPVEIDQIAIDFEEDSSDPADEFSDDLGGGPAVSRTGDLWRLGHHRLLCGDARSERDLARLIDGDRAQMAFLDPPYNLKIRSIVGRGKTQHREFPMASGEMMPALYNARFLGPALKRAASVSDAGAVHFVCMDWRHIGDLIAVGRRTYGEMLNLVVWVKSNAGQGAFYRSQHELIGVFRVGAAPHLNNIQLGRNGRNRSNVWHYAGANSFRAGRMEELRLHPTVKPVALVADAMKDCTRRGDVVLDTFSGSGTTILAAERVGRRAYALEIDPAYVDVAIRRWQAFTGKDAIHVESGQTFEERAARPPDGSAASRSHHRGAS